MSNVGNIIFGGSAQTASLQAALVEEDFIEQDAEDGEPYAESEPRPAPGYQVVFSLEQEQALKNSLRLIGLKNFADLLRFDVFKEKPEKRHMVYAPIRYNLAIQTRLHILRRTKERVDQIPNHPLSPVLGYIMDHLNPDSSDDMICLFPRIKIWDLFDERVHVRLAQTLHDLNPVNLQAAVRQLGSMMNEPDLWDAMFQEIPDANKRAATRKAIDGMVALSTRTPQPPETYERAMEFIEDGVVHEFAHLVSAYMSRDMAMRLCSVTMRMPFSVLSVKNMVKALLDIRVYHLREKERLQQILPADGAMDSMRLWKYVNEMFADYFAIFLKEKAQEKDPKLRPHFYTRVHKIQIPADLRAIFEEFYTQLKEMDQGRSSYLITQEVLVLNPLVNALSVDAALGTVTPYRSVLYHRPSLHLTRVFSI